MIDIGIGQDHGPDRGVAQSPAGLRLQLGRGCDLLADVGRGVEQHPALPVGRGCKAGLRARPDPHHPAARGAAEIVIAVPLRETAARRRPDDLQTHCKFQTDGNSGRKTSLQVLLATRGAVETDLTTSDQFDACPPVASTRPLDLLLRSDLSRQVTRNFHACRDLAHAWLRPVLLHDLLPFIVPQNGAITHE